MGKNLQVSWDQFKLVHVYKRDWGASFETTFQEEKTTPILWFGNLGNKTIFVHCHRMFHVCWSIHSDRTNKIPSENRSLGSVFFLKESWGDAWGPPSSRGGLLRSDPQIRLWKKKSTVNSHKNSVFVSARMLQYQFRNCRLDYYKRIRGYGFSLNRQRFCRAVSSTKTIHHNTEGNY